MPPRLGFGLFFLLLPLACAASLPAIAQERCEGTLCDWYYGGPPPDKPQNAPTPAPRPLTAPSGGILGFFGGGASQQPGTPQGQAAAPTQRMIGVGGGGLAAMARGETQDRCEGTLCDLYYGGPPKEKPASPVAGAPSAATTMVEPTDSPPPDAHERLVESREAPTHCVDAKDPWRCYR